VTVPGKGLLVSGCGFIGPPNRLQFYCGNIGSKWLEAANGKRTRVQIERPHIIGGLPANLTTEDEELGTDHGCGWAVTTARSGAIDHNTGPFS
jgi:hypothetical protein